MHRKIVAGWASNVLVTEEIDRPALTSSWKSPFWESTAYLVHEIGGALRIDELASAPALISNRAAVPP